ncbi:MAG TPA: 23S rRNA (uracil(1939)-C(5))-methyltransferase RlmD [Ignavibacteria bacterium]|nr:23S rRNA (uracil(1939)-C(5))-methyltransferase RlmD [Ignavibacteria bacterium]HRE10070.1 23S rRNA (uracil(1939)-C(5))-methyltransferase RlmD [Ignavibacteria bacterium]HRF67159.1 23S rRNA (uracil(1939)-C(5))-methyltransferase RlmD [Ignavibacteria bacterium]HRJ03186.1 23S rRNA (uracil(1939)-C(5))-methyltransferase RlmD [Ignavibacteria bacterium]HRJ84469.1 23S rRNA (uracil(1939)-C(5))-methyltransferase RlmD [Ignavibacteria bacterium]
MENLKKDDVIELVIDDIGAESSGIGRFNGEYVVFVPKSVPGDTVRVKIRKKKKKYAESTLLEIIQPSPFRIEPECEYFGTCNGCKMQHIEYAKQLEIKQSIVKNAFERIGGFENVTIPTVLGSEDIYYYRNKLEFSFSNDRWLTSEDMLIENIDKSFAVGYHIPGFNEKILDIRACYLQSLTTNKILNFTRDFFKPKGTSIYTTKTHSGYLRFLTVRKSIYNKGLMVNLITYDENAELVNEYAALLRQEIPEATTLVNSITQSKAQVALANNFNVIYGDGFIEEKIGGYRFKITPNTFFQTNSKQCEKLFETAATIADLGKEENVLDLYCGCGAISLYVSAMVKSVHGVELSNESIDMASENAELNGVNNCTFEAMDVKDYLEKLTASPGGEKFDVIILDPPRSGIHPKAAEYLLQYEAKKLIYVSCNPATQARDVALLKEKYNIISIQPVDMFPHTFHIENVVRLDLKG